MTQQVPVLEAEMERHQVAIYVGAIVAGAAAGWTAPGLGPGLEHVINPVLAALLYVTFLQVPAAELVRSLRVGRFLASALVVNFVMVPLVVAAPFAFLPADPAVRLGVLQRRPSGYRIFTEATVDRVRAAQAMHGLGMTLDEIIARTAVPGDANSPQRLQDPDNLRTLLTPGIQIRPQHRIDQRLNRIQTRSPRPRLFRSGGHGDANTCVTVRRCTPYLRARAQRSDNPFNRASRRIATNNSTRPKRAIGGPSPAEPPIVPPAAPPPDRVTPRQLIMRGCQVYSQYSA